MSRIRSKDTAPEISTRQILFSKGYRYRLHVKNLPGKPDLVFPKYQCVIFVHGCFWHLHESCRDGTIPKTRSEYWCKKLSGFFRCPYRCLSALIFSTIWKHQIGGPKEENFCANFVPLAYKNRPYQGICGNCEELSSYLYYYPCLLQSVPVYPL